jgi:ribonuclease G
VIDFIDLPARRARARLLGALRAAVADDPEPVQVFEMSRFGLVELSRRRSGPSLAEMLTRPCGACAGAGRIANLAWRARRLMRELALRPPTQLEAHVAPDLYEYLCGPGRAVWQAFAPRYASVALAADRCLPPGSHRIEERAS